MCDTFMFVELSNNISLFINNLFQSYKIILKYFCVHVCVYFCSHVRGLVLVIHKSYSTRFTVLRRTSELHVKVFLIEFYKFCYTTKLW